MTATLERPSVDVRPGEYGARVATVEPGGAEFIPLKDRHGSPLQLLWTWTSPNLEFATVFVGVIAVEFFGLGFWQAVLALLCGTLLGAASQAILSARGPKYGTPQMILSRAGFGFLGNILPAGLNAVTAGIGWFAVNSVSGAFALNTLLHWPKAVCLLIVVALQLVIAFFGHNLVQLFEKYALPFLAVAFLLATIWTLTKATPSAHGHGGGVGGFLLAMGAAFGYAAGWNPYASDYTRYLPPDTDGKRVGLFAAAGLFLSCMVLEVAGAASVTIAGAASDNPTSAFTGHLPTAVADITLLAIALGAVSANVINIYSGALSFVALGIRLPVSAARAVVAAVFGVIGTVVAFTGLHDAGSKYENFLLVIAYWIGPWLGVFLTDQVLRRGRRVDALLYDRTYRNWAGPIAMAVGAAVSIWLFSNQTEYIGLVVKHHPAIGDITFEVGFLLSAVLYVVLSRVLRANRSDADAVVLETV